MHTVKQISSLAGISIRTLHYYDEIGLLTPEIVGENKYRYYGEQSILRLQQILFYRELGLPLEQIKKIMKPEEFDALEALKRPSRRNGKTIKEDQSTNFDSG